jgi:hypothetical protein
MECYALSAWFTRIELCYSETILYLLKTVVINKNCRQLLLLSKYEGNKKGTTKTVLEFLNNLWG